MSFRGLQVESDEMGEEETRTDGCMDGLLEIRPFSSGGRYVLLSKGYIAMMWHERPIVLRYYMRILMNPNPTRILLFESIE